MKRKPNSFIKETNKPTLIRQNAINTIQYLYEDESKFT